jgi:rhodanese-related sulfurtransferase
MTLPVIPPVVSPIELDELLERHPEVRLLDVRTPGEYETAHIRGAYNVPLDLLGEHGREIRSTVSAPVVLVCQSGQRARRAEEALRFAGMPNLHVLDGGLSSWITLGKPVVFGAPRLSLERQVRIAAGGLAAIGAALALLVSPGFAFLPLMMGSGLVFAGVTNTCGLAMLLARLPYNRPASCDVSAMVRALTQGAAPVPVGRGSSRARNAAPPPVCGAC